MNTQEKEKVQKMIVQNLEGIDRANKAAVTAKNAFREKLKALALLDKDYSQEYMEKELIKLKSDIVEKMVSVNKDIAARFEDLRIMYHDRDAVLDLGNPALPGALSLIATIGGNLTHSQAVKINANFLHDQSALDAIFTAYKSHGVVFNGNIEKLIYNADAKVDELKKLAYEAFVQEGSLNTFANVLSKLAALEGATVESLPDLQGANDAMRLAAGLPVDGVYK